MQTLTLNCPDGLRMDAHDVCAALLTSRSGLYRLIAQRRFPAGIRSGRRVYWLPLDVGCFVHLAGRMAPLDAGTSPQSDQSG